jgi:hypothetical protein
MRSVPCESRFASKQSSFTRSKGTHTGKRGPKQSTKPSVRAHFVSSVPLAIRANPLASAVCFHRTSPQPFSTCHHPSQPLDHKQGVRGYSVLQFAFTGLRMQHSRLQKERRVYPQAIFLQSIPFLAALRPILGSIFPLPQVNSSRASSLYSPPI